MQSQFGVGLREAAHNLRICPTTLKRACRRHGIYRWPRRQSWGGGVGDEGRTDSMNLDGDSLSSAGQPPLGSAAPIPATGASFGHLHLPFLLFSSGICLCLLMMSASRLTPALLTLLLCGSQICGVTTALQQCAANTEFFVVAPSHTRHIAPYVVTCGIVLDSYCFITAVLLCKSKFTGVMSGR